MIQNLFKKRYIFIDLDTKRQVYESCFMQNVVYPMSQS